MGVQYSYECFCGNKEPPKSAMVSPTDCKKKCSGDKSQICGGVWRMNVFSTDFDQGNIVGIATINEIKNGKILKCFSL